MKLGRLVIRKRKGTRLYVRLRPSSARADAIVREIWACEPHLAASPVTHPFPGMAGDALTERK